MIKADVLAHSKAYTGTDHAIEAITMRITLPRIILAEFNTHRRLSKNTSSSRAIPIKKMIKHVYNNMFLPVYWGANRSGMQATEELTGLRKKLAKVTWRIAGRVACAFAWTLNKIGVHKQITNRLIENFSYVTVVMSTVDLYNLLALRNHPDAQPEIHAVAVAIETAWKNSTATELKPGEWHLPWITDVEKNCLSLQEQQLISAARCASTSYQTVDGTPITANNAKKIADKLIKSDPIHASPFEHQLTPDEVTEIEWKIAGTRKKLQKARVWRNPHLHGNTTGFIQYRKTLPNESSGKEQNLHLIIS